MRALARTAALPFLLTTFLLLLGALPAPASHLRGARIWWCAGEPESDGRIPVRFVVDVAFQGDPALIQERFHFGDGTSTLFVLTPVTVHAAEPEGWFVGHAEIDHLYAPGTTPEAGLATCCRINGLDGPDLNNGASGPFQVQVRLELQSGFCADPVNEDFVRWVSGGLGDTFELDNSVSGAPPCRLATLAERGGVPQPDGLAIEPDSCLMTWTPAAGDPAKLWTAQVRARFSNLGESVFDFLLGLDSDRPLCRVDRIDPGPPTRLHVRVHDPRSGLQSLFVTEAVNTTVQVPPFQQGDAAPLTVIGTKVDPSRSSRLQLQVRDVANNETACDPVFTEVVRETGQPERHVYTGIPAAERFVTVLNGDPGLRALAVEVNGRIFQVTHLRPGEERTLDVGAAVPPEGTSTFALTAHGKPGGSAVVMIWDGNGG